VLQCVAVYCSVLQHVAVCCSMLQCVADTGQMHDIEAVCCSVLQCVAMCCSVLRCVAVCCSVSPADSSGIDAGGVAGAQRLGGVGERAHFGAHPQHLFRHFLERIERAHLCVRVCVCARVCVCMCVCV